MRATTTANSVIGSSSSLDYQHAVRARYPFEPVSPLATITRLPLSPGASGTFEAVNWMAACVRGECPPDFSGWQDEYNQRAAKQIASQGGTRKRWDDIAALFYFVRDLIPYLEHPPDEQVVQDCRRSLELGSGDCVSKSVCLATLLACRGYRPRFVVQCLDGEEYSHVYVELWANGRWLGLDPIADGKDGRPLGDVGWRQPIPVTGHERAIEIF